MHVAIFTNNYLPNPYGVSTSVEGFRIGLTQQGHRVSVFAPRWRGDENDGANIYRFPAVSVPTKIPFTIAYPRARGAVRAALVALSPDIVHVQHPVLLGAEGRRWARRKRVPLVFTWHSLYDRYAHYVPFVPQGIAGTLAMRRAARFAQACDRVIAPTVSIVDVMRAAGMTHDRVSVVPSPVDAELFRDADGVMVRKRHNLGPRVPIIVTISRLTQEKNVRFLMRAVLRVLANAPRAVFVCCGEGDETEELRRAARAAGMAHRVVFTGKLARDAVRHYLAAADLFVYASTSETQGTIITEAMWSGVPVVAVRSTGVGDVVRPGVTGVLVAEDESAFARAATALLADTARRRAYGAAARIIARDTYSVGACTTRLLSAYDAARLWYTRQSRV